MQVCAGADEEEYDEEECLEFEDAEHLCRNTMVVVVCAGDVCLEYICLPCLRQMRKVFTIFDAKSILYQSSHCKKSWSSSFCDFT